MSLNDNKIITEGPIMNNQGWICPVCGASVSPNEKVCPKCSGNNVYTLTNNSYTTCTNCENLNCGEQIIFS